MYVILTIFKSDLLIFPSSLVSYPTDSIFKLLARTGLTIYFLYTCLTWWTDCLFVATILLAYVFSMLLALYNMR